jgi:hypothetical protein
MRHIQQKQKKVPSPGVGEPLFWAWSGVSIFKAAISFVWRHSTLLKHEFCLRNYGMYYKQINKGRLQPAFFFAKFGIAMELHNKLFHHNF